MSETGMDCTRSKYRHSEIIWAGSLEGTIKQLWVLSFLIFSIVSITRGLWLSFLDATKWHRWRSDRFCKIKCSRGCKSGRTLNFFSFLYASCHINIDYVTLFCRFNSPLSVFLRKFSSLQICFKNFNIDCFFPSKSGLGTLSWTQYNFIWQL